MAAARPAESAPPTTTRLLSSLEQRLREVRRALDPQPEEPSGDGPGALLDRLVRLVHGHPTHDRVWLLYAAVTGVLPTSESVWDGARRFELEAPSDSTLWLLDEAVRLGSRRTAGMTLSLVTDKVVVDVDHSARTDLHTGIQQVTRQTVKRWMRDHDVVPVVWSDLYHHFRSLTMDDRKRLERTDRVVSSPALLSGRTLVLPWRTTVALPEVPPREGCRRLASLAEHSGNDVVLIGHDCIPVVSAELIPAMDCARFAEFLTVVKHSRRVAGVSRSAAEEFAAFSSALEAQGLPGPEVTVCLEATEAAPMGQVTTAAASWPRADTTIPLVLSVGAFEPRKNHLAIVYASERLWREGLRFELLMIGGSGWGEELPSRVAELRRRGRPVSMRRRATDAEIAAAFQSAAFTVFPSLHEGFGLPVAESLSHGTPVITTGYGSTREIGEGGGALFVDPRDDEALVAAMRMLLTDSEALARLRSAAAARTPRTWEEYAADLWDALVGPGLGPPGGAG